MVQLRVASVLLSIPLVLELVEGGNTLPTDRQVEHPSYCSLPILTFPKYCLFIDQLEKKDDQLGGGDPWILQTFDPEISYLCLILECVFC